MYARSTTVRNVQNMDAGIAYVRDTVLPAVEQMSGCVGLSLLCDREGRRAIATTAWADEGSMHATEEIIKDVRQGAIDAFGGEAEVEEWEIAVMHRLHEAPEGAWTRVIWGRGDPAQVDDRLGTFRMTLIPKMEELPGFCSVSVLVNRESGRGTTNVTYESLDAMRQADAMAAALRDEFTRSTGMEITDVTEFELVLAHLRVPETV